MFMVILILLLITKFISFYFSSELLVNIENYILVYNYIKNKNDYIEPKPNTLEPDLLKDNPHKSDIFPIEDLIHFF